MTRAFYSAKDSKHPVKFSIISIVVNIVLNFLLINIMEYRGLALSTSIASGVNFLLLLIVFRKKYINFSLRKFYIFFIKVAAVTCISLLASFKIDNTILKLSIFSLVYMIFWAKSLLKNRMEVF